MNRLVTALFETREDAERARARLVDTGVSKDRVELHQHEERTYERGDRGEIENDRPRPNEGFFAKLGRLIRPGEDGHTWDEGVRRGHVLLSARLDKSRVDEAIRLLDAQPGIMDVEARAKTWRDSGWRAEEAFGERMRADPGVGAGPEVVPGPGGVGATGYPSIPAAEGSAPSGDVSTGPESGGERTVRVRAWVIDAVVEDPAPDVDLSPSEEPRGFTGDDRSTAEGGSEDGTPPDRRSPHVRGGDPHPGL